MNKAIRIVILFFVGMVLVYNYYSHHIAQQNLALLGREKDTFDKKALWNPPQIALIFDDLGESIKDLKEIYSLKIPVSVAVIPGLKFSKNIAYIAERCNFSTLIHLPLEPKESEKYYTKKYKFISTSLTPQEIKKLLRYYLNSLRVAVGVSTHMGSKATEEGSLMRVVLEEIKKRELIFIDSRTSLKSVAYDLARRMDIKAGYNEGFIDSCRDKVKMREKIYSFLKEAKEKGKIIIIAHPKKITFEVLKEEIPHFKKEVSFITIEEYFGIK